MSEAERGTWKDNPNVCFACSSFLESPGETLSEEECPDRITDLHDPKEIKSVRG
jgi:hypothetical protein